MSLRQREPRVHDAKHLDFIRGLPCAVCLNNIQTEAAHVKMADARAAKRHIGIAEKADDRWCVPLCSECHREQHKHEERQWWALFDIDPVFLALALHSVSGDHEKGEQIIQAYH